MPTTPSSEPGTLRRAVQVAGRQLTDLCETPDLRGAYPRLDDAQIEFLAAYGDRRAMRVEDTLFREGETSTEFIVILRGKVAVVQGYGEENRIVRVHGPRRFLGELGLLEGQPAPVSAVACEAGEVLAIPVQRLRELVFRDPAIGDLILRAYLIRRSLLIGLSTGFRIIGSCYSPDTRRLREFAARNRLPHRWVDVEKDRHAEALLRRLGVTPEQTPVVIWYGQRVLRNPSNAELASLLGLATAESAPISCDLLIVGAGPAGLAAAVYGASEGLRTVALDAVAAGGQAATSPRIENYLGFPSGVSGAELADRAVIQAEKFGALLSLPAEAVSLEEADGRYVVTVDNGAVVSGQSLLIATGARYRRLAVDRLQDFEGGSVHYAATEFEAAQCRSDRVAVVGGGNSAGQAALFLADQSPLVYLLIRHGDLGRDMSRYLVDQIERHPRVAVLRHSEVRELVGDETLQAVVVADNRTSERRRLEVRALFVFIGAQPHTGWLGDVVALDEHRFVLTGVDGLPPEAAAPWREAGRRPLLLETSRPGIFAAGDVRSGSIKRIASAVGEGAMAVRMVHEHLARGCLLRL
jgi:thioredoxin reductase (NADPH)